MRIYFDNCALGRFTDDQSQPRVQQEADALLICFAFVRSGSFTWISSAALEEEVMRNPNLERRELALALLSLADQVYPYSQDVLRRAAAICEMGLSRYDAVHVAFAETAHADVMLTTDDRLLRSAKRLSTLHVEVLNPIDWLARRQ